MIPSLRFGLLPEGHPITWGVEHTSPKVRGLTDREVFGVRHLELASGRNDTVVFLVAVQAPAPFTVNVGRRPVFSPLGPLPNLRIEVVCPLDAEVHPIGLVPDDTGLLRGDVLLNDEVVTVTELRPQHLWVELAVPPGTAPGHHRGQVRVYSQSLFEDEVLAAEASFDCEVFPVDLPSPRDGGFYLDLWQHPSNVARHMETTLWSDGHFAVLERMYRLLGDLGQRAVTLVVSEVPWSGQGCFRVKNQPADLFEYNVVGVLRGTDGRLRCDFRAFDRCVDLARNAGIDAEYELMGLVSIWQYPDEGFGRVIEDHPDAQRVRCWDEASGTYRWIRTRDELKEYIGLLHDHCQDLGIVDRVRVAADEPHHPDIYEASVALVREAAPGFRFKAAINSSRFMELARTSVDDYVPYLQGASQEWDAMRATMATLPDRRYLWYVCCDPDYPNQFISSHPLESRLVGFLTDWLGLDGFLRWDFTCWPADPRRHPSYNSPVWKAGDSFFVYPGRDGRLLPSVRYKMLRRGILDWELLQQVRRLPGGPSEAVAKGMATLFVEPDFRQWYGPGKTKDQVLRLDPQAFEAFRRQLLVLASGPA